MLHEPCVWPSRRHKNSLFFLFHASFVGYVLGSLVDFRCSLNTVRGYRGVTKTLGFCHFKPLSWAIVHCFVVLCRFWMLHEPFARLSRRKKTRCFYRFGLFSWAITRSFRVPVQFLMLHEPCARLSWCRKNWLFLSFRASFMSYNAFLGYLVNFLCSMNSMHGNWDVAKTRSFGVSCEFRGI